MRKKDNEVVNEALYRLNVGQDLPPDIARNAFLSILRGDVEYRDVQMGCFLTGLMAKGPTVNEIVTLIEAAFSLDDFSPKDSVYPPIPEGKMLVGAVGSGKKGIKTMNVSTPAMLIASSLGAYTGKVGSSSTSSVTGSADLMRELGVNIDIPVNEMIDVLIKTGFGFFVIENLIPNFDKVYGGKFYIPHILSFGLPALVNPIRLDNILYGLAHPNVTLSARVLERFGLERFMVVSSTDDDIHYLDEMGIYGTTRIIGKYKGRIGKLKYFQPTEILKLPHYTSKDISHGRNVEENVGYVVDVLKGKGERPRENIICINAGTLLYLAEMAEDLTEGYHMAKRVIRRGIVLPKLREIIDASGGNQEILDVYVK